MGLDDLTVAVLEHERPRAVEDPGRAAGDRRRVAARVDAVAGGLRDREAEGLSTWSDCGGDVERRFTKDELLTNIMLYWAPETANSSCRLYCETMRNAKFPPTDFKVDVPTGCAIFPREIIRPPRAWVEKLYNVTRWTPMAAGGHFAAMEEPALLVDDMRAFFRTVRS